MAMILAALNLRTTRAFLYNTLSLLPFVKTHNTCVNYLKYLHLYYKALSRNCIFVDKVTWVCSWTRNSSFEVTIKRYLRHPIKIIFDKCNYGITLFKDKECCLRCQNAAKIFNLIELFCSQRHDLNVVVRLVNPTANSVDSCLQS